MFEAQGASPELVAETTVSIPVTSGMGAERLAGNLRVYPNPAPDGMVNVIVPERALNGLFELYAPNGSRVQFGQVTSSNWSLELPQPEGTYVLRVHSNGEVWTRRIVRRNAHK